MPYATALIRRRAAALAVVATACLAALAPATPAPAAAPPARFGHAGRWITDAQGRVVVGHGFNMVYKLPPYDPAAAGFGADDAAFLAREGFNVVRVGVIWKAVEPRPGVYSDAYLRRIAATVRTLAAHGILSLLDFHQDLWNERFQGEGAPDWAVQDDGLPNPRNGFPANYYTNPALQRALDHFWENSPGPGGIGLQDRYAAAWRHVAGVFRSMRGVLGYELINEPAPGASFLSCIGASGCPAFDAELTAFDRRVARAIRTVDRRTLIFSEPAIGFDFGAQTHVGAPASGPAGFAFHDYCLAASPNGCPSEPQAFANALAHVARTREALILTEFGSNPYPGDLTGMVALADRDMVPWTEWAYCPCDDPTGRTPDPLVLDPRKPPRGSNLGRLALSTLVEPFPQLVAGTPLSWGYDRPSATFRLRYSTARAGAGARFRAGSVTIVAVPAASYHGRYRVRIRGARVVSPAGAPTLRLASCPGARVVSATLTPGRASAAARRCRP